MRRSTSHRRTGFIIDRRVALAAVGALTVAAAVMLQPLASDAASGERTDRPAAADRDTSQRASDRSDRGNRDDGTSGSGRRAEQQDQQEDQQEDQQQDQQEGSENQQDDGRDGDPATQTTPARTTPAETTTEQSSGDPQQGDPQQGDPQQAGAQQAAPQQGVLGNNCDNSRLQSHAGLQDGNRCVSTAFGEVGSADSNPSLMIASAPRDVRANRPFELKVSTRNLVRDRFLAAAQGGYYKESSFLSGDGIVRGHFHTACRMLSSRRNAPDPAPAPAFFVATEDGGGGRSPDTVTVRVSGLPAGQAQCAVWAGDGSHRVPMMQRANQIPAFDVVRISVR